MQRRLHGNIVCGKRLCWLPSAAAIAAMVHTHSVAGACLACAQSPFASLWGDCSGSSTDKCGEDYIYLAEAGSFTCSSDAWMNVQLTPMAIAGLCMAVCSQSNARSAQTPPCTDLGSDLRGLILRLGKGVRRALIVGLGWLAGPRLQDTARDCSDRPLRVTGGGQNTAGSKRGLEPCTAWNPPA